MARKRTKRQVTADERARQAHALKLAGRTYREIGDLLHMSASSAYEAVQRHVGVLDESITDARVVARERLDLQLLELNRLLAEEGLEHRDRVRYLSERRATLAELSKLDALYRPAKVEVSGDPDRPVGGVPSPEYQEQFLLLARRVLAETSPVRPVKAEPAGDAGGS